MTFLKNLIKKAFQYEAKLVLHKYKPKVIAIIGSVGKTTTRDMLYLVLSKSFFIRKSEKNFTSEIGIPFAIIGCPYGTGSMVEWFKNIFIGLWLLLKKQKYPEYLILEIEGNRPEEVVRLSQWLKVDSRF